MTLDLSEFSPEEPADLEAGLGMPSELAAFASDDPPAALEGTISLARVAEKRTSVTWVEALACIQQICDAIAASGKGPLSEWSIFLHQTGAVTIEAPGMATTEEGVRFVGDLLGTWLEGTPHPMALDTILLASAETPPAYATVAEFSAALKPFERPDRAQLVRAVYQRAGGAYSSSYKEPAPVVAVAPVAALPPPAPKPIPTPKPAAVLAPAPVIAQPPPVAAPEPVIVPAPAAAIVETPEPAAIPAPVLVDAPASPPAVPSEVEELAPVAAPSFRRSQFRTPFIAPEASPTSTLFRHYAEADVKEEKEQIEAPPARRSVQDVAADLRQRVAAAFRALADRVRPVVQAALAFFAALFRHLQPFAKPLALIVIAAVALAALGFSGWLLVTTLMRPSQSAAATAAPAQAEAPATTAVKTAPAPSTAAPAPQPAPANTRPAAAIAERATAAASQLAAAIAPTPRPTRTTSIVLPPARPTNAAAPRPAARAASAPASAALASPIELQPAASPAPVAPAASEQPSTVERAVAVADAPASAPVNASAGPLSVEERWPIAPPVVVYSSTDVGVVPPVQTYPQYVEAIESNRPNATPFQVVIDEKGLVESAVLAHYPADMRQAVSGTLMLGAAKAWRFRPAMKDGQPVKYRGIIWFSNQ